MRTTPVLPEPPEFSGKSGAWCVTDPGSGIGPGGGAGGEGGVGGEGAGVTGGGAG